MTWKILAGVLAAAGSLAAVLWPLAEPHWNRFVNQRRLEYRVGPVYPLFNSHIGLDKNTVPNLKVLHEGREVENPTLAYLAVVNTGTREISRSDFESDIHIRTTRPGALLSFRVTKTVPDNLKPIVELTPDGLIVRRMLLNPRDTVVVEMLGSDHFDIAGVDTRINGVAQIGTYNRNLDAGLYVHWVSGDAWARSTPVVRLRTSLIALAAVGLTFLATACIALALRYDGRGRRLPFTASAALAVGAACATWLFLSAVSEAKPMSGALIAISAIAELVAGACGYRLGQHVAGRLREATTHPS